MSQIIGSMAILLLSISSVLAQGSIPIREGIESSEPVLENSEEKVYMVVQSMPIFYVEACPDAPYASARNCADLAMNKAIYDNLRYPEAAQNEGITGALIVSFIINTDGSTSGHRVTHDLGAGTAAEALRVVQEFLPRWRPGLQHGVPVPVQYRLPIKFEF